VFGAHGDVRGRSLYQEGQGSDRRALRNHLLQEPHLLAGSLDSELSAWRNRRLEAEAYPYLFVDARYEKVRVDGRVVSQGVLVVSGVREDGFREILAVEVANTESEAPTRTSSGPRSDEDSREWRWWSQMTTKA
jgi:hypothetical protein